MTPDDRTSSDMTNTDMTNTDTTSTEPTRFRVVDSPVGPLTVAGRNGRVSHLRMDDQRHPPEDRASWQHDADGFAEAAEQLAAYFAGDLTDFTVALDVTGTEFQIRVWGALRQIPYGETWSYGELARHLGNPGASRAVGLANSRNPVGIIVPCHRVVGADGSLTGYAGGVDRKRRLLDLEQRHARLPLG